MFCNCVLQFLWFRTHISKQDFNVFNDLDLQPQNSIPDVVIWMICGEKRIAYYRIPAYDVLWSKSEDFRGRFCGEIQTISLKVNEHASAFLWSVFCVCRLKYRQICAFLTDKPSEGRKNPLYDVSIPKQLNGYNYISFLAIALDARIHLLPKTLLYCY